MLLLNEDRSALKADEHSPVGVDSPVHFDFDEFVTRIFTDVRSRELKRTQTSATTLALCSYV